jgi:hypothetical protein
LDAVSVLIRSSYGQKTDRVVHPTSSIKGNVGPIGPGGKRSVKVSFDLGDAHNLHWSVLEGRWSAHSGTGSYATWLCDCIPWLLKTSGDNAGG